MVRICAGKGVRKRVVERGYEYFRDCHAGLLGAALPFSLLRAYRARSNVGKSLFSLGMVFWEYVSGILHKIFFSPDQVIWMYILNGIMVAGDIVLYFRNRKLEFM